MYYVLCMYVVCSVYYVLCIETQTFTEPEAYLLVRIDEADS